MLTRTGWAALACGISLIAAAVILDYVELASLGTGCLAALGLAALWVRYRPPLEIDRRVEPMRVTVGEPAVGRVEVTNPTKRTTLPLSGFDRIGDLPVEIPLPALHPGETRAIQYDLPTSHRAILEVGPFMLVRSDPFNLVRADQVRGDHRLVFVHPRRHALTPLPASFLRSLEGPTSDSAPRGTQSFHALREYVPGDDRRMIHWRSSARTGTLVVRQHVDTSLPDLTVVLDTRGSRYPAARFEEAVEIVASLVVACADRDFPVRVRTMTGLRFDAPADQHPTTWFLDRLAGVNTAEGGDLTSTAQVLQANMGFALVIVTARPSQEEMWSLTALTRRFSSTTLVDLDPGAGPRVAIPGVHRVDASSSEAFAAQWNRGVIA